MSATSTLLGRPAPRRGVDVTAVPPPQGPPALGTQLGEARAVLEVARLVRAAPWLARAPRGGSRVIDLPGWRAPEASNLPLRLFLRALGHDPRPWGLGTNLGDPEGDAERLVERLRAERGADPVALVGWSLGGVVAREVARALPDRVSRVVTFGSPIVGGPSYTFAASRYPEEERRRITALIRQLDADRPIEVPITAIYSRRDGVVDWRACVDHASPRVEHVEVGSTHLGLGLDPDVWWTVAQALAA